MPPLTGRGGAGTPLCWLRPVRAEDEADQNLYYASGVSASIPQPHFPDYT